MCVIFIINFVVLVFDLYSITVFILKTQWLIEIFYFFSMITLGETYRFAINKLKLLLFLILNVFCLKIIIHRILG